MLQRNAPARGFTLVELLVVVTIIALLVALLVPAVQSARSRARQMQCENNQRNLAQALLGYATQRGQMPASRTYPPRLPRTANTPVVGWVTQVLVEIGSGDVADRLHDEVDQLAAGGSGDVTLSGIAPYLSILICASDTPESRQLPHLSYVVNGGRLDRPNPGDDWPENGVCDQRLQARPRPTLLDRIARADGTSMTILLSENTDATRFSRWNETNAEADQTILWQAGAYNNSTGVVTPDEFSPTVGFNRQIGVATALSPAYARPSSRHVGGVVMAFCDGSVRFVHEGISYRVYALLMTPDGAKARDPATGDSGPAWQATRISAAELDP